MATCQVMSPMAKHGGGGGSRRIINSLLEFKRIAHADSHCALGLKCNQK